MKLFRKKEVIKYQRQCDIISAISLISGSIALGLAIYSAMYNSENLTEIKRIINDTDGDAGSFSNVVDDAVLTMGQKKEEEQDDQLFSETLLELKKEMDQLTESTSELMQIPIEVDETEFRKYQNKVTRFSEKCGILANFCKNELSGQSLEQNEKIRDILLMFDKSDKEDYNERGKY